MIQPNYAYELLKENLYYLNSMGNTNIVFKCIVFRSCDVYDFMAREMLFYKIPNPFQLTWNFSGARGEEGICALYLTVNLTYIALESIK